MNIVTEMFRFVTFIIVFLILFFGTIFVFSPPDARYQMWNDLKRIFRSETKMS